MFLLCLSRSLRGDSVAHVVFHICSSLFLVNVYLCLLWREKQARLDGGACQWLSQVRVGIGDGLTLILSVIVKFGKFTEELLATAVVMLAADQ